MKTKNPLSHNLHIAVRQLLAEARDIDPTDPDNSCWEIPAAVRHRNQHGYTIIWFRGRDERANRIVSESVYGPFTDKAPFCLHRCDNPGCIRPTHLFRGTQGDNLADMMQKGRYRGGKSTGEANGQCMFPDVAILDIHRMRSAGLTQAKIARVTGVSDTHVGRILAGKTRADIYRQYHGAA